MFFKSMSGSSLMRRRNRCCWSCAALPCHAVF